MWLLWVIWALCFWNSLSLPHKSFLEPCVALLCGLPSGGLTACLDCGQLGGPSNWRTAPKRVLGQLTCPSVHPYCFLFGEFGVSLESLEVLAFLRFFVWRFGKPFHVFHFPVDPIVFFALQGIILGAGQFCSLSEAACVWCMGVSCNLGWGFPESWTIPGSHQPGFPKLA